MAVADALIAPVCLVVNGLLIWASWHVSRRFCPADRWFQHLGHTCLIWYATVVLVGTLLGSVGLLIPWLYLSLVGILALVTLVTLGRSDTRQAADIQLGAVQSRGQPFRQSVSWTRVLFLGVWTCVASFWVAHTVIYGVLCFPSEWDTLMYHLPFVDLWLQHGSLYVPEHHLWSNPANNELITLWVVGPFSGDFFYSLSNLPAVFLTVRGALEVGRNIGLSFCFRQLAALAVVTHQMVQVQLQGAGNDMAAAGLFLCCLMYVLRYAARARRPDLLLGVMALGLLAGTKYYALGYALIAILIAVWLIALRLGKWGAVEAAGYGLVGMVVFGGYWYLRNLLVTGTPLYPFGAPTEGDTFADVYPGVWESTFVGNQSPEVFDLAMRAVWDLAGPCHWAALLFLPATAAWVFASAAWGDSPTTFRRARAALAAGAIAAIGVWAVTPFAAESDPGTLNQLRWKYTPVRFGLSSLSLCILVFCLAVEDLARGIGRLTRRTLAALVPYRVLRRLTRFPVVLVRLAFAVALAYQWDNQDLHNSSDVLAISLRGLWDTVLLGSTIVLNTGILVLAIIEVAGRCRLFTRCLSVLLLVAALGFSAVCTAYVSNRWHRDFISYYDSILGKGVFQKLAEINREGGTVCVMDERYYPYFGSARQYRIVQPPPTQSAAKQHNGLAWDECRITVVGPIAKFKWTQTRAYIANHIEKYQLVIVQALPDYFVYIAGTAQ